MSAFSRSPYDREIAHLAIPALGALAVDPLVSLVDTAYVGRLGAEALASLAVATAVFTLAFAMFNFLAYGTTPLVAGAIGRGDLPSAGRLTVNGLIIGAILGVASALLLALTATPVLEVMGATTATLPGARDYLVVRSLALPAVMIITVGHGAFRGYQDTRTPLYVTLGLNAVNLVLDPIFIFGLGAGLVGAAWATVIAQWTGALAFLALFWLGRARLGIKAGRPGRDELRMLLGAGRPLVIRTLALLGTLTLATAVAARVGTVAVAAYQVLAQLWLFLSLVVDALAIAAQAMIGKSVGAASVDAREIANRLLILGLGIGFALAAFMALAAPWLTQLFTDDPAVIAAIKSAYVFVVVMQPLNAVVFVWDGIVIGATDFGYLAVSMVLAAVMSSAVLLAVVPQGWGLAGVWWGLVVLMATRALTLLAWHLRGPLSVAPDPSPSSPGA